MQRPPLLEPNGFFFWKACFETYVKSKDIDLWQVIQNGDFYFEVKDEETKLMKETPYELLKDTEKKQIGKNEEAKMNIYNALPRKEYEHVFMCKTAKEVWHTLIITHQGNSQVKNCKIDLLTQEYEKFSISNEETIDSGFTRFNAIRAKVMAIEEAKDLATLPLEELIRNLKVYEMVLDNDGVDSKTTKEKVKSLALKAKVTREQTSDDSDSQGESDEEVDEKEAKAFNLLAWNFRKFFRKGNRFGRGNRFGNGVNRFGKGRGSWSDSEDGDEQPNDATCLVAIVSQEVVSKPSSSNYDLNYIDLQKENEELLKFNKDFIKTFEKLLKENCSLENENSKLSCKINDLELEVKKLENNKEVVEACQKCVELTQKVDSLKGNVSKLQDEALNFSKFKEISIALDDMLRGQKLSQDKKCLGFSKSDKTNFASPNKPIVFVKQSQKEILSNNFVKPIAPQTPFVNTRGTQAPNKRVETKYLGHHSDLHNRLGYSRPRVNPRPILPTPHMRPSNSYARRPCFQNNRSSERRIFLSKPKVFASST
ncbi:hypothetical protein Tco_1562168 [Tanacetum coccineum]